ncbi:MAG TPA: glycosyltransferase family 1 protein, partial [Mycobacteriales bacterium]|nr:glycosyltransferase family 1 protein [Mycobacteriales bacterium]
MRLAVLVEQLLGPTPGGTGRFTRELATALAAGKHAGDVLTGWTARHADVGAAAIDGIEGPRPLSLPAPVLARLWPRGLGPGPRDADVVLAPTVLAPPRRRGGPALVVAVHDAVPWTAPETQTPHSVRFHRAIIRRIAADADAVVVPTRAVADELARRVPALTGPRVHVIGEGAADAVTIPPADAEVRALRLGLPDRYLLLVGTLEPRKGIDTAIAALAAPGAPDLPLLLVGQPGWGAIDPIELARSAGLAPGRVQPLGRLDDPDLAVTYARASAVLVPSRDEGFGLPVVEAMAHGTPVVVADVPALVETAGGAAEVVP